jgi:2Fe-2S ferredoxin
MLSFAKTGHVLSRSRLLSRGLATVRLTIALDDDTQQVIQALEGQTVMEALDDSDFSDVWEGGVCGGACNCSTCRVVIAGKWADVVGPIEWDEEDMLDSASNQQDDPDGYLENSRLGCQIKLTSEMDGMEIMVPEIMTNMMEIPLWLRNR